jgi:hypothetical protein
VHASIGRPRAIALPKSEVDLPKSEVSGADASLCRQLLMFRACAAFHVNLILVRHERRASTAWEKT